MLLLRLVVRPIDVPMSDQERVVMIHASGLSSSEWRKLAPALEPRARVLAPDLVGYGRAEPIARHAPATARDDLDALAALLERFGPAQLVGHSYGGYLAAKLALAFPQLVTGLVLIEPVLFGALRQAGDVESAAELSRLYDDPTFLDDAFGGTEEWMQRFIDYWAGAGSWSALPDPARRANMRVAWKIYCEVRDLSRDPAAFSAYRALDDVPVTLVRGALTTVCARRIVDRLAVELPRATTHVLQDAGHMSPLTHPSEVLAVIEQHLVRTRP